MAETLKEFLVSIGYVLDEGSAKQFDKSLAGFKKTVMAFGAALASAEGAIVALFSKVTVGLDQANFAATRAGTSVASLQSMAYALEQTGRRGAAAGGVVESVAAKLRNFPAAEGMIKLLGVKTRVNGTLRDMMDIVLDIVEATSKDKYSIGAYKAGLVGIAEADYEHLRRNLPEILRLRAEQEAAVRAAGVDKAGLVRNAAAMMASHRALMMRLDAMLDGVVLTIAPALVPVIEAFTAWIKENKDAIEAFFRGLVEVAERVGEAFGRLFLKLGPVALWFDNIIHNATGERGLVVAIEALSGAFLASIVFRMLRVTGRFRAAIVALVATIIIGRYVAPETFGSGPREAPVGPDERPKQGFFGRAFDRVRGALGMGPARSSGAGQSGTGRSAGTSRSASGAPLDRTSFAEELKDPKVRERLLALTESEVGSQGVDAQQAFMESTFNRAKARGRSLWDTMHGSYFPAITHSRTAAMAGSPRLETKYKEMFDRVYGGSNIAKYATGNASGSVGFGRNGYGTFNAGGEKFGVESQDVEWAARAEEEAARREAKLKEEAVRKAEDLRILLDRLSKMKPLLSPDERDEMRTNTPWGRPADKLSSGPLINDNDDFGVTTNRTTKITVHGDTDPHKTADEVARHQGRVNTDMITSTERAFA